MAYYLGSILPPTHDEAWIVESVEGHTEYTYSIDTNNLDTDMNFHLYGWDTNFNTDLYHPITGSFLQIIYDDVLTGEKHNVSISLDSGYLDFYLNLPAAVVNKITFKAVFYAENAYWKLYFCPIEQSVNSVDIEFAVGQVVSSGFGELPSDNDWQSEVPEWNAVNIIAGTYQVLWARVVTTFTDGHIGYSVPKAFNFLGGSNATRLEKLFYLSTSAYKVQGGAWVSSQPIWSSGKYIFTCLKVTQTSTQTGASIHYTEPIIAQAFAPAITHNTIFGITVSPTIPHYGEGYYE